MQMPFTRAEFLDVFAALNHAIWPLQVVATVLGVVAVGLLFRRTGWADRAIAGFLAAIWLLTGAGYHWLFFSAINTLAWLFGALFVAAGTVFAIEGAVRDRIRFVLAHDLRSALALLFVAYALVIYPLIGLMTAESWSATPLFGVTPCPTTIFTLGLLLIVRHPRSWLLATVPVFWGFVGGSAAFLLRVPQDYGLVAAAATWIIVEFTTSQPARG